MSTFNIYLNSKNIDVSFNGSKKSDVRFIIKSSVNIDLDQEALSVKLNHFNCSNTFYNITSKKNTISINGIDVTIPEGSYLIDDLLDYLNTVYTNKYTFTYDDITRKVTIVALDSFINIDSTNNTFSINNRSVNIPDGVYSKGQFLTYIQNLSEFKNGLYNSWYAFSLDANNNLIATGYNNYNFWYFPLGTTIELYDYYGVTSYINLNEWQDLDALATTINNEFISIEQLQGITFAKDVATNRYKFTIPNYQDRPLLGKIYTENLTFFGFTGLENETTIIGTTKYFTATNVGLSGYLDINVLGKTSLSINNQVIGSLKKFETLSGTSLKLIGFEESNTATNNAIISPYVYNLNTSQHMYVKSNFQVANIGSFDKRSGYTLAYVPLGVFDGVVAYQNYSSAFLKTDTKNINYIDIKITDDEDDYIDFKNHNWSLSLEFLIEKLF